MKLPGTEGVYLLAFRGRLIYVGTSAFCERRIHGHYDAELIQFDSYWYADVRYDVRLATETRLIRILRPLHNVQRVLFDNSEIRRQSVAARSAERKRIDTERRLETRNRKRDRDAEFKRACDEAWLNACADTPLPKEAEPKEVVQ